MGIHLTPAQTAYLLARLRERSTWTGLFGLLSAMGLFIPDQTAQALATAGVGVASALAVLLPDSARPPG